MLLNCKKFNDVETLYYKAAVDLEKFFDEKWKEHIESAQNANATD